MKYFPTLWQNEQQSPFRSLSQLQREFDRLFDGMMTTPTAARQESAFTAFAPACDIQETATQYLVSFDLPGVTKDQIRLEIVDNQLRVHGERKEETEKKEGETHRRERFYGTFERAITLPENLDAEKSEAHFENGVLKVAIAKTEAAVKKREIQIKEGRGGLFGKVA